MQHWQCWKVSTTRIFGSERAISIHWFQHQPKAQIPGHSLPIPCPKALLAVNLNVLVLPFHMRSCAHWHCALREHQSTKHNQLQLPAHSIFIIRSVVHWKPKVKINLSTTVNWEKKNARLVSVDWPRATQWELPHQSYKELVLPQSTERTCTSWHPPKVCLFTTSLQQHFAMLQVMKVCRDWFFPLLLKKPRKWMDYFFFLLQREFDC